MKIISVVIVDSDAARAETCARALNLQQDLRVLCLLDKRELVTDPSTPSGDVMVLQSSLLNGRNLGRFLQAVHKKSPGMRTVVVHDHLPDDESLIDDIRNGVHGYLRTGEPPALISKAVRAVAAGHFWVERRILEKTIARHILLPETLQVHVPDLQPLTFRERDVLNMVLKGASNREIAEMSNISERTVKTHLYRVYRKLRVKSRAKAIALLSQP